MQSHFTGPTQKCLSKWIKIVNQTKHSNIHIKYKWWLMRACKRPHFRFMHAFLSAQFVCYVKCILCFCVCKRIFREFFFSFAQCEHFFFRWICKLTANWNISWVLPTQGWYMSSAHILPIVIMMFIKKKTSSAIPT